MIRSLSETELSALENELRVAFHQRAASTPLDRGTVAGARTSARTRPAPRWRRRGLVAIAAAAATVAAVVGFTRGGSTPDVSVETTPSASGLPDAEVPRLVIEGAALRSSDGENAAPVRRESSRVFQVFRRAERLDGPMIFLTTLRPYDPATFGILDDDFGERVDLRGEVGYVAHHSGPQGATTLSVKLDDGNAIYLIALGLDDDELVSFVDGLEPTPSGRWSDTTAPQGVREVAIAPLPADGRAYSASFDLPGGAIVEVHLYQDGFEDRLSDRVASTIRPVEQVTVDGLPAVLGAYSDTDWWTLIEPEPGRALELRVTGDRVVVDQVLVAARFVDEATWDATTSDP